jgi:L-aminopeptidase/D-esterase-like protein
MIPMPNTIIDISGIEVGHATDLDALTGCTVILSRKGAVAGVDVRGGAPGTRETDLLNPLNLVEKVHAIVLAGGSAFGLDAASGVMRYLEEQGIGFDTGAAKVPIVPSAILYDLAIGSAKIRPDADMGYRAAESASAESCPEGNVGAGTGATVGKIFGMKSAMKSGLGSSCVDAGGGVLVGALVAVNAFGDVFDPQTGAILAGARSTQLGPLHLGAQGYFANTLETMRSFTGRTVMGFATKSNTVIGVVATNAHLEKAGAAKVAQMAHDGLARVIRPAHTMLDGDTIFALSSGNKNADVTTVGAFAAEAMVEAILRAVQAAESAGGLPGLLLHE